MLTSLPESPTPRLPSSPLQPPTTNTSSSRIVNRSPTALIPTPSKPHGRHKRLDRPTPAQNPLPPIQSLDKRPSGKGLILQNKLGLEPVFPYILADLVKGAIDRRVTRFETPLGHLGRAVPARVHDRRRRAVVGIGKEIGRRGRGGVPAELEVPVRGSGAAAVVG